MPSYFCPQLDAHSVKISLDGDEHHHLGRVKRKQAGDIIILNNGQGLLATAKIHDLQRDRAILEVLNIEVHSQPKPLFAIAFALLKNHHDELAIEKCTELGAQDFFPLSTQHSVRSAGKNTISRFRKVALSAIKQCNNPFLPMIHETLALDAAIPFIASRGYIPVLCSEKEQRRMLDDLDRGENLCFIIGPEGGFSDEEFALLKELQSIMLSPLITRAETAAIVASAQFVGLREHKAENSL